MSAVVSNAFDIDHLAKIMAKCTRQFQDTVNLAAESNPVRVGDELNLERLHGK